MQGLQTRSEQRKPSWTHPCRRRFGKQGVSRRSRAPRPAQARRAHVHSTLWDRAYFRGCIDQLGGRPSFASKNDQPNEASMSSSPKSMLSLLPLPGAHCGPRCMDVVRHLHLTAGIPQRSVADSHNRLWLLLGILRRLGTRFCFALSRRVLLIGPTTPDSITTSFPRHIACSSN